MTKRERVEAALVRRGLKFFVCGVEANDGGVIIWPYGQWFGGVREAVAFVARAAAVERARWAQEEETC